MKSTTGTGNEALVRVSPGSNPNRPRECQLGFPPEDRKKTAWSQNHNPRHFIFAPGEVNVNTAGPSDHISPVVKVYRVVLNRGFIFT